MDKPILSICIPTYTRAACLKRTLNNLITYEGQEIEIVVSDNGSIDNTQEIVQSIQDPRIKYFRNQRNLGFDVNIILVCERASSDYIFFLSDEDYVNLDLIPWVEDIIRQTPNLSIIFGSVGDKRPGENPVYYQLSDSIDIDKIQSLMKSLFTHSYMCGVVLKKSALNFKEARYYIGSLYMHQILMGQALMKGTAVNTSKLLVFIGPKGEELGDRVKTDPVAKGIPFFRIISRIKQLSFRLRFAHFSITQFLKIRLILAKNSSLAIADIISRISFGKNQSLYSSIFYLYHGLKYTFNFHEIVTSIFFWIYLPVFLFKTLLKLKLIYMLKSIFSKNRL